MVCWPELPCERPIPSLECLLPAKGGMGHIALCRPITLLGSARQADRLLLAPRTRSGTGVYTTVERTLSGLMIEAVDCCHAALSRVTLPPPVWVFSAGAPPVPRASA